MARLIEELRKLPGIGSKNAQRLAFHILRSSGEDAEALADAIQNLKAKLRRDQKSRRHHRYDRHRRLLP